MIRAVLIFAALLVSHPVQAQSVVLTPGEMRQAAVLSNRTGQFEQARALAQALLAQNPDDIVALIALTDAFSGLGDHDRAAAAAADAYHRAPDAAGRYVAARMAAREHLFLDQGTRAQIWLRRARQNSPSPQAAAEVAQDFGFVRDRNPLDLSLSFGVTPKSNINNGTFNTTQEVVIFGIPLDLPLSGDAQALSGLAVSASGRLRYTVAATATRSTTISVDASGETYVLSDAARAQAPGVTGADFSYVSLAAGVMQAQALNDGNASLSYGLTLGEVWSGTDPYYTFARATLDHGIRLGPRDILTLGISHEWQRGSGIGDPRGLTIGHADWSHRRDNGDDLTLSISAIAAVSDNDNYNYQAGALALSYGIAAPVLGGHLSLGAEVGARGYDISPLTLAPRTDTTFGLRASYRVDQVEYYGFSPELSLSAKLNQSNVGRYQTRDLGLGVTLVSRF